MEREQVIIEIQKAIDELSDKPCGFYERTINNKEVSFYVFEHDIEFSIDKDGWDSYVSMSDINNMSDANDTIENARAKRNKVLDKIGEE